MKPLIIILALIPFFTKAQFTLVEYTRADTLFIGELEGDTYGQSSFFKLTSEKDSVAAAKITSLVYWDIFDLNVHDAEKFDSLLHNTYGSYSPNFTYEIIENSDRFFTIEVSYGGFEEDDRKRYCYSFRSAAGEWFTFFDIFKIGKMPEVKDIVFTDFQEEINGFVSNYDSTHYTYSDLKRCAKHYFNDATIAYDGDVYLDSDSVYFSFQFCPDVYHVYGLKHDYFQKAYSHEVFSALMNERTVSFARTGEWEYTMQELFERSPLIEGTINDEKALMKWVEVDGIYHGNFSFVNGGDFFEFTAEIKGEEVFLRPKEKSEATSSILKFKNGVLSGLYIPLDKSEYWELDLKFQIEK